MLAETKMKQQRQTKHSIGGDSCNITLCQKWNSYLSNTSFFDKLLSLFFFQLLLSICLCFPSEG